MRRVLRCNDLNPGCTFEAWGYTDEDVLKKFREHAKTVHKMNEIPLGRSGQGSKCYP